MTLQGGNNECDLNKYGLLFYSFMTDLFQQCLALAHLWNNIFRNFRCARKW